MMWVWECKVVGLVLQEFKPFPKLYNFVVCTVLAGTGQKKK